MSTNLLNWTLTCENGIAVLVANWHYPKPRTEGFVAEFILDETPVVHALPLLRRLSPTYDFPMEDIGTDTLHIHSEEPPIQIKTRGTRLLLTDYPELEPLVRIFDWLDAEVMQRLPWQRESRRGKRSIGPPKARRAARKKK